MAIPNDLESNKYSEPQAFNSAGGAKNLTWADGSILNKDIRRVAASSGGVSTFSALTDAYDISTTAGTVPMTNAAGTALIPVNIIGDGQIDPLFS